MQGENFTGYLLCTVNMSSVYTTFLPYHDSWQSSLEKGHRQEKIQFHSDMDVQGTFWCMLLLLLLLEEWGRWCAILQVIEKGTGKIN